MDSLKVLEQKLVSLVSLLKDLKAQNEQLQAEKATLESETEGLKAENATLAEDNAQLTAKLDAFEDVASKGTQQVENLNQEKMLAKRVVDDLIKSIDLLVEREDQQ